jgi:hypothetical protein
MLIGLKALDPKLIYCIINLHKIEAALLKLHIKCDFKINVFKNSVFKIATF